MMDIEEILKALNANASQGRKASAIHRVISNDLRWHVEHGDSLVVLKSMPDACVDAIVTDPPAGVSFMGKEWDDFRRARNPADAGRDNVFGRTSARGPEYGRRDRDNFIAFLSPILAECYRVTKPGGRMLCWSIPRTMHWTGCAIEDAGWSIENTIAHLFGSGFPKAKTQLKPAREDWWLARKPAKNVLPLNIDQCRVTTHGPRPCRTSAYSSALPVTVYGEGLNGSRVVDDTTLGRWPANLALSHFDGCVCVGTKRVKATSIHGDDVAVRRSGVHAEAGGHQTIGREQPVSGYADADGKESVADWRCVEGCPVAELDRQSIAGGIHSAGRARAGGSEVVADSYAASSYELGTKRNMRRLGDSGGASRFFNTFEADPDDTDTALFVYQAKASRADRNAGDAANTHPTVKSTPLCRHLVKLIAKPGDVVLDAFCGSGSTGRGAVLEGCRFIGIEREDTEAEPYVTIARRRIADATKTQ